MNTTFHLDYLYYNPGSLSNSVNSIKRALKSMA